MAQTILEIQLKGVKEAEASMQALSLEIDRQKKKQAELRADNKKQQQSLKDNEISQEDYTKAVAQNNIEIEKSKKIQKDSTLLLRQSIRVTNAEVGTLESKRAVLAKLQNQFAKLNTETDEGARKAAEMSEEIQKLTKDVKEQEKSIGDTRRNVGNYEEAIKDAVGSMIPFGGQLTEIAASGGGVKAAFTALSTGLVSATRAAIAFIATGIGAVIAALAGIGLATKAFIDYNAEVEKTNALISGLTNESGELVDQIRLQSDAISQTLGVEQEQLVQSAKVLVQQFGLTYEEALGKIQNGLLATNGANDEFLQSIGEYSTFFSQAGFSVEEFSNIVNAGFDLGIYSDKLPDALKEADISLREQTKATREALTNAFGDEFTGDILNQINAGALSTKDALTLISQEADNVGLSAEQAATLTADVFRGAGEDAGGALKVFEAINVSLSDQTSELDEQGKRMEAEIKRQQEVAEARDKAFNSKSVQSFTKALKDVGAFLQKAFFKTIQAFAFIVDVNIIQPIKRTIDMFNRVKDAAASAIAPLKSIGAALGITSKETDNATQSSGQFAKMLQEQKQAAEKAAAAQAQLETETAAAEAALKAAKEEADAYATSLRDIAAQQERQPILTEAEDIFSELSAEEVLGRLQSVATQFEENAELNGVHLNGLKLTNEEFAQIAQNRLDDIDRAEEDAQKASERRSNQRRADNERTAAQEAQQALDRIKALNDIVNAEQERNMTEEELLTKRLNDKLRELELDKDITDMTDQELAAREALLAKFNDDIKVIRDKANEAERLANEKRNADNIKSLKDNFDDRLKTIDEGLKMELLVAETAHLNELRNFQGTEEQKIELQKQFQANSLELQKQAIQDQIAVIEQTLAEGDLLTMLETGILDESTNALAELRNALASVNLEIANAGKDEDGEPKTIAEQLGLDPDNIEKALFALDTLRQSFAIAQQAIGAAESARLKQVDEQVEKGVITKEQAEAQKERISKKAAREQQKISIIEAIINVAQGITKTFATVPSLFAPFVAATIAAQGAVQIATIKSQKFAKGGLLSGPSHAQGGIQMFSKGGAFFGEAEGGEAIMTKGVMANPALASMASAINVAGGGVPFFANGGVLDPIQSATPTDRAADIIASGMKSRQPVLVVEQLRERENSVDVIESLRTIG